MDTNTITKKRQKLWKEHNIYKVENTSDKSKYYVLDMFPYPSGAGLHVGHPKGYIASDVLSRKKLLEGYNVLHPMGFDTFGLGTENYAIKNKIAPQKAAADNIKIFKEQLEKFGFTYDWEREINTADPKYYKWTQWIFLKFYTHYFDEQENKALPISHLQDQIKAGKVQIPDGLSESEFLDTKRLAYIDYKPINWCPNCKTGLANEDLADGKCERCEGVVEQKPMRQWVLRITTYAEKLLEGLDGLDRDESMKELQRNRIGKSEGTQFAMKIKESEKSFEVYTTRIDTVFGMSFVVMAPEHPLVAEITTPEYQEAVKKYQEQAKHKTQLERTELQKDKNGQFTGAYAINPFNNEQVPIYIADYVLVNYGTGVVMAVPAHDERDFEFAKKYNISITQSIAPKNKQHPGYDEIMQGNICYPQKGVLVNSGQFSGLTSDEAIPQMQEWLAQQKIGGKKTNYKIQDWVFSRQRYWGEPFPMLFDEEGKVIPLTDKDLPLELPKVKSYEPTGTEEGPLADITEWINYKDPDTGKEYKRESNTMPGRAGSSRYWLRYMDPQNDEAMISPEADTYWKDVDVYVGGAEHVTRHMIYARFWQKFLHDIGIVSQSEPFKTYHKVGLIMAEDGRKMSKRRGNVVNPDDVIAEHGTDALRVYEMFMGPFEQSIDWNTSGVKGVKKFLEKLIALQSKIDPIYQEDEKTLHILHTTIKKVSQDIDVFGFNTAIAQMMILVNHLTNQEKLSKTTYEAIVLLLAPFAPHTAEELWEQLGNEFSIFTKGKRPTYEEQYLTQSTVKIAVQFNGKVRGTLEVDVDISQDEFIEKVKTNEHLAKYFPETPKKIIYIPGRICNIVG